ncbi:peptidoglycan DD-metalloendopeptidase family protein [Corynebacterium anserum]|uniref:Peptidoglycan DD-metalloendopeptidase family protein n=1 Tax=Corynebacterium anserum TaxID=2684406 RepID=A0A7G7YNV3_9CORY|nr:peptidoglycan DD-metalloendopeptidase family protein [Corynebacterium anserum]
MKLPGLVKIVSYSVSAALLLVSPITLLARNDQSHISRESVAPRSLFRSDTGGAQDLTRLPHYDSAGTGTRPDCAAVETDSPPNYELAKFTVSAQNLVETENSQRGDLSRYSATHRLPITHERNVPPNNYVLREADIPERNWEPGHRGVDLKAQPGDPIYASRGGIIYFAGEVAGTPVVSILHSDGLRTTYEPITRTVSINQRISRGQLIGHLADTATLPKTARAEPGLSWGARDGDTYVNPMLLLGLPTIRLKSPNPEQRAHSG